METGSSPTQQFRFQVNDPSGQELQVAVPLTQLQGWLKQNGYGNVQRAKTTAAMVAGTITVADATVTANSVIILTTQALGTVSAPQALAVTARTVGTSFVITSAGSTDTSVVGYVIIEP